MNISATLSSASATVAEKSAATAAVTTAVAPSSSADSATISDAGNAAFAAFEASFKQVQSAVNAYGHQVTWELDHHVAVTGPTGTAVAPVATTSAIGAQLVNTQVTSALATAVSLRVAGDVGSTQLSFAAGTKLSAIVSAFNNVSGNTGVSAAVSGASLKFDSTTSGANQFVTVAAAAGSFAVTAKTSAGATQETIAESFAALDSKLQYPYVDLTDAQYAQWGKDLNRAAADQSQFQKHVSNRITPNYGQITHQLSSKINSLEHQVTWDIDNGALAAAALPDTIDTGFSALESAAAKSLGSLSTSQVGQFQQLEKALQSQQKVFTAFAVKRLASKTAHATTGSTKDVAG